MTGFELTNDDKAKLLDMLQSPAWDVLCRKVWDVYSAHVAHKCATDATEPRFNQGFYAGFNFAQTITEDCMKEEKELQFQRAPNEAALLARRKRTYFH